MLFNLSREDLRNNKITNIAMCTHIDTEASIKMMEVKNFYLAQSCLVVFKNYDIVKKSNLNILDFKIEKWNISYEYFKNLDYFKTCNNKLTYGFTFLNICENVFDYLVKNNSLLKYKSKEAEIYITNPYDKLITKLKENNFKSISHFKNDCVYYVYDEK